jgi:hypothetical protein
MWCDVVCQSVQATAAESSFYGDHEVQTLSTANAYVTAGTFTVAYGAFSLQLPGTVSGYSTEFIVVPEPNTLASGAIGLVLASWCLRQRCRNSLRRV